MSETPVFATAAVAAPHLSIAEAGQMILAAGGNAIEAMVAMAARAAVVSPHANGMGGDGFWLVREPKGRVHALDAAGPAGASATIERYRKIGHDVLPSRGPEAAVTVAGAVGGWGLALELSKALGGQMPLDLLLGDAIRLAREGHVVSGTEARVEIADEDALRSSPGFANAFLSEEGKRPAAGSVRRMPKLADALDRLAHAGLSDFYRGDVGREIAADLERIGSPILRRDLETYRPRVAAPLSLPMPFATLYTTPPASQGLASLLVLGIAARLNLRRGETPEQHHALIEATKRAFAIRDRVLADPRDVTEDLQALLAVGGLEREASHIDARRAVEFAGVRPLQGASVWMGCIDKDGLAVSYSQSVGAVFGSGCVLPTTGIHWQAQGIGFSLDPDSRNPLEPGRKPIQASGPGLATFQDGRVLVYGTDGEDPQVQAQILTRYAEAGMNLAEAVETPRWLLTSGRPATLAVEENFDPSLARELSRRGHLVEEAASSAFGQAGMIAKYPRNGRVEAIYDPRADGAVLGL